ncbi:alpha/beta hydrolase [Pararcticibacter amylolyticus]|uniref:Esterase n=1 Tax=Pararcticibacter amylolyticus TaxID=2173175 RepID=A0A2U2PK66_9SPHI|nr:alpha/beta hydrolase family protein [Pararcticibacter amylolyticus]PWG81807.1 esterase [Pararcticibacter amylolyticus]
MRKLLVILLTLSSCVCTKAQEVWVMKSRQLERPDTVLIYKPAGYTAKKVWPLVYLLHGYSENYRQWSKTTELQELASQYGFIIVTPDGFTTYYTNSPDQTKPQFENFFFRELIPRVHQSFNIDTANIFISGLSMGGYGALRYFILHPEYFNSAGATSGALEIDYNNFRQVSRQFWKNNRMTEDLTRHFGSPEITDWHQYSISTLLKQHQDFNKPFIFDCGVSDILYPASTTLKTIVDQRKLPATFISSPGNHDTSYWRQSIAYHFLYFQQHLRYSSHGQ